MSRGLSRVFGVWLMMVSMLMGMTGRVHASPTGTVPGAGASRRAPLAQSTSDVIYQVLEASDGSVIVTASSSEVSFRKTVYADGYTEASFERGRDRVTVVATAATITVSRGASTVTVNVNDVTEEALARVRGVFGASPALRAFRSLVAAIEDEGGLTRERLALRLTGALVAQLDGDEGAIRRLHRALRQQLAGPERRVRHRVTDCWSIYADAVIRAAAELEKCYSYFNIWDPRRNACSFVWVLQVEGAWFGYLSCSSVPIK